MAMSKDQLFARYEELANRLEQHFLDTNDTDGARRFVRLNQREFKAICDSAKSDPVVRGWLYCIQHGYPGASRSRREAA